MFYTVSSDKGIILETSMTCPDPQEEADYFKCAVYIIEGQHTGLDAEPNTTKVEGELAERPRVQSR